MFRLIYFNASTGYKTIDYKDENAFTDAARSVKDNDGTIICVVDYYRKSILNKCADFEIHHDNIDRIIFDPKVMGLYY
jgi:hypothetical protein